MRLTFFLLVLLVIPGVSAAEVIGGPSCDDPLGVDAFTQETLYHCISDGGACVPYDDVCTEDGTAVVEFTCLANEPNNETIPCEFGCVDGACLTSAPICGDGFVDAGEECDDGNNKDNDGCSATCSAESSRVCTDDAGIDGFIYDYASDCPAFGDGPCETLEDTCLSFDSVAEATCLLNGSLSVTTIFCEQGCINGVCINGPSCGELDDPCNPDTHIPFCTYGGPTGSSLAECIETSPGCYETVEVDCASDEWCDDGYPGICQVTGPVCGDGALDASEQCDMSSLLLTASPFDLEPIPLEYVSPGVYFIEINSDGVQNNLTVDLNTRQAHLSLQGGGPLNEETTTISSEIGHYGSTVFDSAANTFEFYFEYWLPSYWRVEPSYTYADSLCTDACSFDTCLVACTPSPACSDGIDNDGDGFIDFGEDLGCATPDDDDESGDYDGDGCFDAYDVFPTVWSPDTDGDGIADDCDNCVVDANADQSDTNGNGVGDMCETDPSRVCEDLDDAFTVGFAISCPAFGDGPCYTEFDSCYNNTLLVEAVCAGGEAIATNVPCANGCFEGACISDTFCGDASLEGTESCELAVLTITNAPFDAVVMELIAPGVYYIEIEAQNGHFNITVDLPNREATMDHTDGGPHIHEVVNITTDLGMYGSTLFDPTSTTIQWWFDYWLPTTWEAELTHSYADSACSSCNIDACVANDGVACSGFCGDGVLDGGEKCDDGNEFDNDGCSALCEDEEFFCGDGILQPGEQCDTSEMTGYLFNTLPETDESFKLAHLNDGTYQGVLNYTILYNVTFNLEDLVVELHPIDGRSQSYILDLGYVDAYWEASWPILQGLRVRAGFDTPSSLACSDFDDFTGGTLYCSNCVVDVNACTGGFVGSCGDGNINIGEQCDGTNLSAVACGDFGFVGGELSCNSNCQFDTAACIQANICGNSVVEGNEACDDGNTNNDDSCTNDCTVRSTGGSGGSGGGGGGGGGGGSYFPGTGGQNQEDDGIGGENQVVNSNDDEAAEEPLVVNADGFSIEVLDRETYRVSVENNEDTAQSVTVELTLPNGWEYDGEQTRTVSAGGRETFTFKIIAGPGNEERVEILVSAESEQHTVNERVPVRVDIPFFIVKALPTFEDTNAVTVYVIVNADEPREDLQIEVNLNRGKQTLYVELITPFDTEGYFEERYDYPAATVANVVIEGYLLEDGTQIATSTESIEVQ